MASEVQPRSGTDGGLDRPVTRRNFIVWYLAGLLTATVLALVAPILVFIYPPAGQSQRKQLPVALDKPLDSLDPGSALKFEAPKEAGFVMADGGGDNAPGKVAFGAYAVKDLAGKVTVFAVNCSHLGCSVGFNGDARRFECPCHGSMFSIEGQVIHGPALFPLSHLDWQQGSKPDEILVNCLTLPGIG